MLKKSLVVAGLLVYFVVSVSLLRLPDDVADWLTVEDGFFEALGAAALLAGSVFAAPTLRREKANGAHIVKLIALVGLALFLFVAFGEEISWGQRYLGIETPGPIAQINSQDEVNLHNLYGDEHGRTSRQRSSPCSGGGFGMALPLLALVPPVGLFSAATFRSSRCGSRGCSSRAAAVEDGAAGRLARRPVPVARHLPRQDRRAAVHRRHPGGGGAARRDRSGRSQRDHGGQRRGPSARGDDLPVRRGRPAGGRRRRTGADRRPSLGGARRRRTVPRRRPGCRRGTHAALGASGLDVPHESTRHDR